MTDRLRTHQDTLYQPGTAPPVTIGPRPQVATDRYEAFRLHFPDQWHGSSVLELGAGSGVPCRTLIEDRVPFDRYVVSDYTEQRTEGLARDFADDPRVEARQVDVEQLPADLGQFDAVVLVAVIVLLRDPLAAFQQIREHLNPGGILWVDAPNIARWTRRLKLLAGRFPATGGTDEGLSTFQGQPAGVFANGHLQYYTWRSLEQLLLRAGFTRLDRVPYAPARLLGGRVDDMLARARPTVFADVTLRAHA